MSSLSPLAPDAAAPVPAGVAAERTGRPLAVFINPHAGLSQHPELATHVRDLFRRHGLAVELRAPPPARLLSELTDEVGRKPRAVVVGGGDGTLNTAATALVGTGTPLGILPLGTFNHFAKDAGVPVDLPEAVAAIAGFVTRDMDVAEVNGRIVLNNCSVGGYAQALRRRETLRRRAGHGKWRAMIMAALSVLRRIPRLHVALTSPSWSAQLRASFVMIVNNQYADDVLLSGRRARLDQGLLWVYASRAHRYRDLGRAALDAWRFGIHRATRLECWHASELQLDYRERAQPVAVDGEVLELPPPLQFRSRPSALRVIVPREPSRATP